MTKMHLDGYAGGSAATAFTTKRRQAGTTLVEILVVIVIFLIGILAVVQIFPRGFRLLLTTRNNSVATALGRDAVERLKSSPDLIPDAIVPVRYSGGVPVVDTSLNVLDYAPLGDAISAAGVLTNGGDVVATDWMLASGPNRARRVVGEGHRLPAPRLVGSLMGGASRFENYGGLLVLDHGPIDPGPDANRPNVVAYGNDLNLTFGAPREAALDAVFATVSANGESVERRSADGSMTLGAVTGAKVVKTPVSTAPFEAFVVDANSPAAAILLPTNQLVARTYRVRMSAYLTGGGSTRRFDYLSLSVRVPRVPSADYPLVRVYLSDLLADTAEAASGYTMAGVEPDSIQLSPQYVRTASWTTPDSIGAAPGDYTPLDPFEMKIADRNLGVLIFSPAAREGVVPRPGGVAEPLVARVDYDVRDWRILGEEFRVVNGSTTFSLALQSLKVGDNEAVDGLNNGGLFTADRSQASDPSGYDAFPTPRDNVVVVDLTTGFEVQKSVTNATDGDGRTVADVPGAGGGNALLAVDKSRGSVTLLDADANASGVQVRLLPPSGGGAPILVNAENRSFRVLYRARQEWAVQILKGASQYRLVNSLQAPLAADQAILGPNLGGGEPNRIYFPKSEAGHKVTIDRIAYEDAGSNVQLLEGQDFVVRSPKPTETPDLPYVNIAEAVPAVRFATQYGLPVRGIKGASVSVRVLWNPESFKLGSDAVANMARVGEWDRGWRRNVTETYLRAEETR